MGCGGLGGVIAAHLHELDHPVYAVSRNPEIAAAVTERGFRLRGDGGPRTVRGVIYREIPAEIGPFQAIVLATQPQDLEGAARAAAPHLAEDGVMVCLQNGLCEERVAAILGDRGRVAGAIVAWGATMVEPGIYDRTSSGGFTIGMLDGGSSAALDSLAILLEAIGPVQKTENLVGARWSKLAINCAISALGAASGQRLGQLVRSRWLRRLTLEIMSETVAIAQREGVALEKVSGTLDLEWMALTPSEQRARAGSVSLASKHAMLLAVGMRYRRLRSSMLAAIERGRRPPIDFLNGEIVRRATRLEIPAPVNRALVDLVERVAAGELSPDRRHLREVYQRTR